MSVRVAAQNSGWERGRRGAEVPGTHSRLTRGYHHCAKGGERKKKTKKKQPQQNQNTTTAGQRPDTANFCNEGAAMRAQQHQLQVSSMLLSGWSYLDPCRTASAVYSAGNHPDYTETGQIQGLRSTQWGALT